MKALSIVVLAALTASFQAHACGRNASGKTNQKPRYQEADQVAYLTTKGGKAAPAKAVPAAAKAINEAPKQVL